MNFLKSKFVNNTLWMVFSQVFYLGISFFVSAYAARILGPNQIGIMDYSNNYISILLVVSSLGIDTIVIKDIINNKEKTGEVLGSALIIKTITAIFLLILINIFFILVVKNNTIIILVGFLQSFLLIFKLYSVFDLYYQSKLESKKVLQVRCFTTIIIAIFKIFILINFPNLIIYVILTVLEHFLCLIIVILSFRKTKIKLKYNFNIAKSLVLRGYHFILSDLLVMIYTRIDKIMLASIKGTTILGIYSVATLLSDLWTLIPNALIASARPKILEYKNINIDLYERKIKQLYAAIFYLGFFISIIILIFSNFIINLLYGNDFITASIPMIILSFSSIFALLGSARSIWIIGENLQKYTKYYVLFGAITNIIFNFLLIYPLGMIGVAFSTLISQIMVALISPCFIKKTRKSTKLMIDAILLRGVFRR